MTSWLRDFRYAARQLANSPGFTFTVLATLGLCIGVNTAVYSVVDAVLLRPLPYPQPERLAMVARTVRSNSGEFTSYGQDGTMWEAVRDHASMLETATLSGGSEGVNLVAGQQARYVQQQRVSANFFKVLGVPPLMGREFTRVEDSAGGPPVAVLSYDLWQRLFHGGASPVGQPVMLRGEPYTVVGVMPANFRTPSPADLWTPLRPSPTGEGAGINCEIVARLTPAANWAGANSQMETLAQPLFASLHLQNNAVVHAELKPLQTGLAASVRSSLLPTWGAVALVLLIGCVNIAGLLLARSGSRSREIAARMSLGASRTAIVRQLLAESLILAGAGGVLGVLLGECGRRGLKFLGAAGFGLWQPVTLNGRVLLATLGLSLLTSLLFGLAPALAASRVDLRSILVEGGRGASAGRRNWSRQLLVVGEVALGLVLLIGAGLMLRTLEYLTRLQPGFDSRQVITAQLSLQDARYRTSTSVNALFDQSLRRIRETPGVESAAVALSLPYQRPLNDGFRLLDGPHADEGTHGTEMVYVTPGFFETLRIPIFQGRTIAASDSASAARIAVVNQAFVRRFLRDQQPVGSHIGMGTASIRIVGVAGDTQQRSGLGNFGPLAATPAVYIPAAQTSDEALQLIHTWFSPSWVVRAQGSPAVIAKQMQSAVEAIDPQLPFAGFRPMDEIRSGSLKQERYHALVFSIMAGLALLLAALGIYGLIAHSVAQRKREMGIRMALGAAVGNAIWTVVKPGFTLALAGVALGCLLARMASSLLETLLWGVRATDIATYAGLSALLLAIALLASVLPALRLLRLNPAETLRSE